MKLVIKPFYCLTKFHSNIRWFHSVRVVSAQLTAFLAHARLTHIFSFVLDLLAFVAHSATECVYDDCGVPKPNVNVPHTKPSLHTKAGSSRIPLLFVSLVSTVDHHNRLYIVWNFSPDSRVYSNRAHFYYRSV